MAEVEVVIQKEGVQGAKGDVTPEALAARDAAQSAAADAQAARTAATSAATTATGAASAAALSADAAGEAANVATQAAQTEAAIIAARIDADLAPVVAGVGYAPPVPFASGLVVDSTRFTVSHGGEVYAPVQSALPFTTTGTFNPAQWRMIQGVAGVDLSAPSGAGMVGFRQLGPGSVPRTLEAKGQEVLSVKDKGARGNGVTNDHAAILAAFNDAKARKVSVYFPAGTYLVNDNFLIDSAFSGITIYGDGPSSCIKLANTLNSGNLDAGWLFHIKDTANTIRDFRISGLRLDGSRATTSWATTSHGVIVGSNSLLKNVQVDNCIAHGFRTQGFNALSGPIRLVDIFAYDNEFHGVGVSVGDNFGEEAEIYNVTCDDNGGYGVDIGRGRAIVRNAVARRNTFGGMKISVGVSYLDLDGALLANNVGSGFLNTGDALDAELIFDNIVTRDNGQCGFICSTGALVTIGRIISINNDPATVNGSQGDVMINAEHWVAESIHTEGSTAVGLSISGACQSWNVGSLVAVGSYKAGLRVAVAGAKPTHGVLRSAALRNNNREGLSGNPGAALQILIHGTVKVGNVTLTDTQGVPTQTAGMFFSGSVDALVEGCHFGAGIAAGGQVHSSGAGTRVRFGEGNTGIVTRARGVHVANGGGTNLSVTFPVPMTGLGGAVFHAQMTPASPAAAGSHYVSGPTATALTVIYTSATPSGTANVSYSYDVKMEIQR